MNGYGVIGLFVGSCALLACSGAPEEAAPAANDSALGGAQTYLYLRCNATGWNPDDATRLRPTSAPGVFELSFEVSPAWLLDSKDHCQLLRTNQLNGWGTTQSAYHARGVILNVPASALLEPGYGPPIVFDYPELGRYTVTVDVPALTLAIEFEQTSVEGGWIWPLDGENGVDWVINNYIDLDPSSGVLDYTGGWRAYDGHIGVDVDVATFRDMDAGVPVRNVTAGEVVAWFDDNPDRNTSCTGDWNYVAVRTAADTLITYGHLKRDSVVVDVGDTLAAGDIIALVGSSGCSTQPHLHLEAFDRFGNLLDPFRDGLFAEPPAYAVPLGILDIMVSDDPEFSWVDPGPNITTLDAPWFLVTAASLGGGHGGDTFTIRVIQPDDSVFDQVTFGPYTDPSGHTVWIWNWDLSGNPEPGDWRVEYLVNGALRRSHTVNVLP